VKALTALLADDSKFGFIVMDGNCALFGSLSGNTREVLHKFTVDLPKKHGNSPSAGVSWCQITQENLLSASFSLQCFDAVGWATGTASGL